MSNIHKYVRTCEISIDAATKNTYENNTRLGGNWGVTLSNLEFISSIKTLNSVKCSFVVQKTNYKEMHSFLDIMINIFDNKAKVFFGRINNWGTFSDDEFKTLNICDTSHDEHVSFLNEFKKVSTHPQVFHNMYEFLDMKKNLI
jgi:hypothetical protein